MWEKIGATISIYPAQDELIVSPQLGSNPEAILEIAEEIGWGNVYLLEQR